MPENDIISTLDFSTFVVFRNSRNIQEGMQLAQSGDNPECLRLCRDGFGCSGRTTGSCHFTHLRFTDANVDESPLDEESFRDDHYQSNTSDVHSTLNKLRVDTHSSGVSSDSGSGENSPVDTPKRRSSARARRSTRESLNLFGATGQARDEPAPSLQTTIRVPHSPPRKPTPDPPTPPRYSDRQKSFTDKLQYSSSEKLFSSADRASDVHPSEKVSFAINDKFFQADRTERSFASNERSFDKYAASERSFDKYAASERSFDKYSSSNSFAGSDRVYYSSNERARFSSSERLYATSEKSFSSSKKVAGDKFSYLATEIFSSKVSYPADKLTFPIIEKLSYPTDKFSFASNDKVFQTMEKYPSHQPPAYLSSYGRSYSDRYQKYSSMRFEGTE